MGQDALEGLWIVSQRVMQSINESDIEYLINMLNYTLKQLKGEFSGFLAALYP